MRAASRRLAAWAIARADAPSDTPPGSGWMTVGDPCTVAAALRAAGQWSVDEPPRDFDAECWWYRTHFEADEDDAVLGFDGIATASRAWLNGELLFDSTSMFAPHRCDLRGKLSRGTNELLVRCDPLDALLKAKRPRPRWRVPMLRQQQLRWWRTTLLGRTPGWSPPAAPVGLWRDVWISPQDIVRPEDVRVDVSVDAGAGVVRVRCDVAPAGALELRLARGGRTWRCAIPGELRIEDPELWWPHTHGVPALYEAALWQGGERLLNLAPVGFRSIGLDTADGGFALRVNGEPVFCRGAVWMPLDPVSLRASPEEYEAALAQVRAAGMNMLRVAGTTVYEEDAFHEACDRAGVLVWQDLMFANMDYPAQDEAFVACVRDELARQLARWGSHPSLAVLCGNSEVDQQAAMWGAPRELWQPALFHETIPAWLRELAPRVPYWPSSAHGGAFPHEPASGTTSYYGVGAYLRPLADARASRLKFATESLAFANVPEPRTIARMPGGESLRPHHPAWKARTPRDLGAGWDFEDVRDHYLEQLFGVDARTLRSHDLPRYLALSRIATGEAMAQAFFEWRRPGSRCGGALVLMLRDLQAGAGWGLLDDAGRPKACWHVLRRVLQPVALLLTDEGLNGLHIHAVNDTAEPVAARLRLRAWQGGDVQVADASRELVLPARGAITLEAAGLFEHFLDLNWAWRFGPAPCDIVQCTLHASDGQVLASAHHFPSGRGLMGGRGFGLQGRVVRRDSVMCEVAVTTASFAYGVHFEQEGMTADDEHFHLAAGDEARVILRGALPPQGVWVRALNHAQAVRIAGRGA